MSANAATWFYHQPEQQPFMVTERLNGTFWQARMVNIYWRCIEAGATYRAEGYVGDTMIQMEWVPAKWLRVTAPADFDLKPLMTMISKKVLAIPASFRYADPEGNQIVEWHRDGGAARWAEIQGKGGFMKPQRLSKKGA